MLPLRDNVPRERHPLVSTVLVAAMLVQCLLSLRSGAGMPAGDLVQLLGDGALLWLLGPSVEDHAGHLRFLVLCLLGGLAALGGAALLDAGARDATVAATGAAAVVLGAHVGLFPRARMLLLLFIPLFFTMVEVPTAAIVALWMAEELGLALAGLLTPIGAGHLQWLPYGALLVITAMPLWMLGRDRPRPAAFGRS